MSGSRKRSNSVSSKKAIDKPKKKYIPWIKSWEGFEVYREELEQLARDTMVAWKRAEDECGGRYSNNLHFAPIIAGIGTRTRKPVYDPGLPECEAASKLCLRTDELCAELVFVNGLCPEMVNAVVPMIMDPSEENLSRYRNLIAKGARGRLVVID